MQFDSPTQVMQRALELAGRGRGHVEPNPMVGAVLVDDQLRLLGEGFHQRYGGPHAEVEAIADAGERARGATLFVTLEPCCHFGKTPPCTRAVLNGGIARVEAAMLDPFAQVAGQGATELRAAGVPVNLGLLRDEAIALNAPYLKRVRLGQPWVHAKWAMTLDGQISAHTGHSKWITSEAARERAHELRAQMDAIIIGVGTALADDPQLTVRLSAAPAQRVPLRIVLDSQARLPIDSALVQSIAQGPVLVGVDADAPRSRIEALQATGVEVVLLPRTVPSMTPPGTSSASRLSLPALLELLAGRGATHVLIEGGRTLLGDCFANDLVDEVHAFVAPKLVLGGGRSPLDGLGLDAIPEHRCGPDLQLEVLGDNVYWHGRLHGKVERIAALLDT